MRRDEGYEACEDEPPAGYFSPAKSTQKPPWGNRRGRALSAPNAPVSPWYPLSEMRIAAAVSKKPPYLRAVTMPVRLVRIVTASPEQSYPPRLVSCCNSRGVLNAARSLCAVFQPPVEATQAFPLGGRCPSAHTGADEGNVRNPHTSAPLWIRSTLPPSRCSSFSSSQQVMNTCPPLIRLRTKLCRRWSSSESTSSSSSTGHSPVSP